MPRPREDSPFQLYVEGPDDGHSIIHLMGRRGFDWNDETHARPYVSMKGGIDPLLEGISIAVRASYDRVGFVVDADVSVVDRWAQIRDRLVTEGLVPPASPDPAGTIIPGTKANRRVGVWLMPDNQNPGTLESFLQQLVPGNDPVWPYALEAAVEARERGGNCAVEHELKSRIHTWLAWQEQPGMTFGVALRAAAFQSESTYANAFGAWFNRLFVSP